MQLNGLREAKIPYLSMMKKAMQKERPKKNKIRRQKLTEIDRKTNRPCLKQGIETERAIEVLYLFESTGMLPVQIEEMKITVENLRRRVKKLEDWQE